MNTERFAERRLAHTRTGWSHSQRKAAFTVLLVAVAVAVPCVLRAEWRNIAARAANVVWGD